MSAGLGLRSGLARGRARYKVPAKIYHYVRIDNWPHNEPINKDTVL